MKTVLNRLFEHDKLSREEARQILVDISGGQYNHIQVASFTTVFNMRPITLSELQGFRDALLELCVKIDLGDQETLDIVGTGGDGKNTFNVSTTSAMVIAGAGYKVSKHGSYGVSSSVGSSNVLIELGYRFTNDQDTLRRQLDEANMCFLHAPLFHPAMKEVVPVRKQLGMKTFFNMLGPLVNPLQPKYQLFGTFSMELSRMFQYIMQHTGRRFAIVYALDGYDEISLTGDFKLRTNDSERIITPKMMGYQQINPKELYGGETAEEAATTLLNVLQDKATPAQKAVVMANAGLAIRVIRSEQSMEDCLAEARESIESGRAYQQLQKLVAQS
ncbi:MAG TPA: anthranilate phosphoribosyltransferase [Saprospiraceae bacterium]|nr:anthranilate phosphoribosyltransferase [Saprospiraceae bacterium]